MLRHTCSLAATCLTCTLAAAQPMASITVTANGGASAVVQPGQPIAIAAMFSHNSFSFAEARGSTIVTDHAGSASGFASIFPAVPTVNYGAFVGGSRVGGEFLLTPPGFLGGPTPPYAMPSFAIWRYTLTLDQPGEYQIDWVADANFPAIHLYPSVSAFNTIPAQSTYIGATITVVPAPASALLLITLAPRRGRRPHPTNGAITC